MANVPDEKSLPEAKKDSLADKVADTIHREVTREFKNLRDHEVSKSDTNEIVSKGIKRGIERVNKDLSQ